MVRSVDLRMCLCNCSLVDLRYPRQTLGNFFQDNRPDPRYEYVSGLTDSTRPLPIAWNQSLTSDRSVLVRVKECSSELNMHLRMHLSDNGFSLEYNGFQRSERLDDV